MIKLTKKEVKNLFEEDSDLYEYEDEFDIGQKNKVLVFKEKESGNLYGALLDFYWDDIDYDPIKVVSLVEKEVIKKRYFISNGEEWFD